MGQPIAKKDLGKYKDTNLQGSVEAFRLIIDSDNEVIIVEYRIKLTSPLNQEIIKQINNGYQRFNRQAILYREGETITPAIIESGVEITPAIIATGNEVKLAANLKFDQLRALPIGELIEGMILNDLNMIQSFDSAIDDLKQA